MTRARRALRRAGAHRGLLLLVVLLVAAVAATSGAAVGAVSTATTDAARTALSEPESAGLTVTTRLAEDPAAQDARVRGAVEETFGGAPVAIARSEMPDGADLPFVVWTLAPVVDDVTPDDLDGLATGSATLRQVLRDDDAVAVRGLVVEGDLGRRAAVEHVAQSAARAAGTVPAGLLVLVALVAFVQVARLLANARQAEIEILVARGAASRQITTTALAEASLLGVVGAGAGTALATGALVARGAPAPPSVLATGAATALVAATVLTVVAAAQARSAARRQVADRSGRLRRAAALGTVVGFGALAVLGMVRLRSLGSPLVAAPDGVTWDPLAASGPALALAASGMLTLALLGPLARTWAALAARGRGATGVLAARQVARGLRVVGVAVVLLVLAGGSAVLAGAYAGTTAQARADLAIQRVGTDVRALLPSAGRLSSERPPPRGAEFAALDGARAAAPVLVEEATIEGEPLGLTALPAASAGEVVRADDVEEPVALLDATDPFDGAPVLPDGATSLSLAVTGAARPDASVLHQDPEGPRADEDDGTLGVAVSLWLAADDGTLGVLDAGTIELDDSAADDRLTVDLPSSAPGLRLAAVELGADDVGVPTDVTLAVRDVVASTSSGDVPVDVASAAWNPAGTSATPVGKSSGRLDGGGVLGIDRTLDPAAASTVRLVAGPSGASDGATVPGAGPAQPTAVPAVLTRAAAERWDAAAGDRLEVTVAGSTIAVELAGTVEEVPGQPVAEALLVDLGTLDAALLRTSARLPRPAEVWIASRTPDDAAAVARLADAAADVAREQSPDPADVEVRTAQDATGADAGSPVRQVFVLAATGATALALVGLAVVALSGLASRRDEVVVLRAVGLGPRAQGAGRALEVLAVGVAGLAAGALAGWAVSALAVPGLVHGVVGGVAVPVLAVDLPGVTVVVAVAAVAVVAAAALVASRVAAQTRDTDYRPEVR